MKLWNKTKLSDRVLKPMIRMACKQAGCKPDICVQVFPSNRHLHGWATTASSVKMCNGRSIDRWSKTNVGFFRVYIPLHEWIKLGRGRCLDLDAAVIRLFGVLVHEAKHVADFQTGGLKFSYKHRHENRPHEVRARITQVLAVKRTKTDDRINKVLTPIRGEIERMIHGD